MSRSPVARLILVLTLGVTLASQTTRTPSPSTSTTAYELGTRVTITVSGQVTAIRFWKIDADPGPHVGHVWLGTTLLATVPFTGETASGWQQQAITPPMVLAANRALVVSVNAVAGAHFAVQSGTMATAQTVGPLTFPAQAGVYGSPGVLPTITSPNDYFRDLVFTPDPPLATVTTGLPATGTAAGAFSVPGAIVGLLPGIYAVAVSVTNAAGRTAAASSSVTVGSFPFLPTDAPRRWAYTVITGSTASALSAAVTVPPTTAPVYATLAIPVLPAGATGWRLYRTTAGGAIFRLVATIPAPTLTATDRTLDSDLGAVP